MPELQEQFLGPGLLQPKKVTFMMSIRIPLFRLEKIVPFLPSALIKVGQLNIGYLKTRPFKCGKLLDVLFQDTDPGRTTLLLPDLMVLKLKDIPLGHQ